MQTSLTLKVVSAHKLVGVDSGGTCDPYFILEANDKNFNKVNYKSKKYKKALNPNYNESLFLSGVTRKQIIKGEFVGKPVVIDFFDWNQFQKHTFLGRALIELTPEFFVQGDTVKLSLPLKELKAGENYLTNSKVKKTKSGQITSPVSEAKGKSKQNLQFSGLGTVEVEITLDDQNISEEELTRMRTLVQLSTEKITSLYAAFKKSSKENIKDVPEFIKILNDSNLFEAVMTKWNGSDPTANEHWHLLSKDKDFMEILCSNLFHAFDVDGDGNISFEEACNGLYSLLEGNSDAALRMRFRSIDLDRSGYIDMAEAKVLGGKTMAVIRCGFMIGLNAKKYEMIRAGLSEDDFLPILDAIDKAFTQNNYAEKEAKLLFKYADKDENGKISEDEYVAYMQDPVAIAKRTRDLEEVMKPVQASMQKNVQAALIQLITRIQNRY